MRDCLGHAEHYNSVRHFATVKVDHLFASSRSGVVYRKLGEDSWEPYQGSFDGEVFEPKTLVYVNTPQPEWV
jgi:hypothetical protein